MVRDLGSHRLASCTIVSGFRAALDLNTYPLRNLIRPRCAERAKPGRGKPVLIIYAYWLFSLFSRHISRTQSFQQNRHVFFLALVALKLLVSLMSRLVACSPRIVVDRQTDRQTHSTTTVTLAAHARRGLIIGAVAENRIMGQKISIVCLSLVKDHNKNIAFAPSNFL